MNTEKYILLIEDDVDIRETMFDVLKDEGFAVQTANNGQEALDFLRSAKQLPALILLDIMMPVMDGYQFREHQVKDPVFANIPTAMISADGQLQQKASRIGLTEFLKKPVDIEQLFALAHRHCS